MSFNRQGARGYQPFEACFTRLKMGFKNNIIVITIIISWSQFALSQSSTRSRVNPTIIQDSRDLPQTDGAFGFLYRTEDGISHGAVGEPGGVVHGRYTYTDPTGLKVNFNYNAGTRTAPGYNYNQQNTAIRASKPVNQQPQSASPSRPRPQPTQSDYDYNDQPQYQPQTRPRPVQQPQYEKPQPQHRLQPQYDIPQPQHRLQPRPQPSQGRRSRPTEPQNNLDYGSYTGTF